MKKFLKKEKPAIIKPENPVYLRLRYPEAIESKKDLLFMESSLLTVLKIIKRYNLWRTEELRIKSELYKALKELNATVKKTKSVFPFLEIPESVRRRELIKIEQIEEKETKPVKEIFDENLESQLRNIQERLRSLGA